MPTYKVAGKKRVKTKKKLQSGGATIGASPVEIDAKFTSTIDSLQDKIKEEQKANNSSP